MAQPRATTEPPVARGPQQHVEALLALMADGWQIEPPVIARPCWSQQRSNSLAYHFIVARNSQRSLVVIADSTELRHFLREHTLAVLEPARSR